MWSLLSGYIFGWPHDLEGWLVTFVFHDQECICEAGKWRACWFHGHGNSVVFFLVLFNPHERQDNKGLGLRAGKQTPDRQRRLGNGSINQTKHGDTDDGKKTTPLGILEMDNSVARYVSYV